MYHDLCDVFTDLSDEQAGKIIKEIIKTSIQLTHDNPKKPTGLTGLLKAVFNPFYAHLTRDYEKWEAKSDSNKLNGMKGGRPVTKTQPIPKKPVKVNVNVNVNEDIEAHQDAPPPEKIKRLVGKRFNDDMVTREWIDWAIKEFGWGEKKVISIGEEFTDYWIAVSGQKAIKLDWLATWRNWCRKQNDGWS